MERLDFVKFVWEADLRKIHIHFSELQDFFRKVREYAKAFGEEDGVQFDEFGMLVPGQDFEELKKKRKQEDKSVKKTSK